jgi:hypothetical protein
MHRIVCNVSTGEVTQVDLTAEEIAEANARQEAYVLSAPVAPTKEQLLAQLNALSAQIQALE